MMTIQQMVDKFEKEGFKVEKRWNRMDSGSYEFTIRKNDVFVGGVYKWHADWNATLVSCYQEAFINDLLCTWKKESLKRLEKQLLNSTYGKDIVKPIYISTSRPAYLSRTGIEDIATQNYIDTDIAIAKELWTKMNPYINKNSIKNVIFNNPATIVLWTDGTKTVVKCQNDEIFDPEKGLAMAIAKKALGNKGNYCNTIKKWVNKAGNGIKPEEE